MERKDNERIEEQCEGVTGYQHLKKNTNTQRDERDEQIKHEPDTARLRSERQSVLDNEEKNKRGE